MKEGLGCLKIDTNNIYVGNFHHNQFDGEGILNISSENKNINFSIIKNQKEENDNDNDIAYENKVIFLQLNIKKYISGEFLLIFK